MPAAMSSLIPEQALIVSPQLAATIGLEEALLLGVLNELQQHRPGEWCQGTPDWLHRRLPFWQAADVARISQHLQAQGILRLDGAPFDGSRPLLFSLAPEPGTPAAPQPKPATTARSQAAWQPSAELRRQLQLQAIPDDFVDQQLPEFRLYWQQRDPGSSINWDSRFYRHVVRAWRDESLNAPLPATAAPAALQRDWLPDADALAILMQGGVPGDFIEEAIPEFVLYWRERGDARNTWNSNFIQHVRRQWLRVSESLVREDEARRMTSGWQPDPAVFDILAMANIDVGFAQELLPEFVLYWQDSGEAHPSWNSRFLRHIKHRWAQARQHSDKSYAERLFDTVNDTGWASSL